MFVGLWLLYNLSILLNVLAGFILQNYLLSDSILFDNKLFFFFFFFFSYTSNRRTNLDFFIFFFLGTHPCIMLKDLGISHLTSSFNIRPPCC